MAKWFEDIGFSLETARNYWNLRLQVIEQGETIYTRNGTYFFWSPSKGVELWGKLSPEGDVGHLYPHFSGAARMQVALVEKKALDDNILAEGFFVAYPNPHKGVGFVSEHVNLQYGDGTYSGYVPFVFNAPDYDRFADLELPVLADVQITAFPFLLWAYESEDEWIDKQIEWDTSGEEDPYVWSGETFVPAAFLFQRESKEDYPRATAYLCGTVLETAIFDNEETGAEFCWAKIHTHAGDMDVVACPKNLSGYVVKGGVVVGDFYLSGRIVSIPDFDPLTE